MRCDCCLPKLSNLLPAGCCTADLGVEIAHQHHLCSAALPAAYVDAELFKRCPGGGHPLHRHVGDADAEGAAAARRRLPDVEPEAVCPCCAGDGGGEGQERFCHIRPYAAALLAAAWAGAPDPPVAWDPCDVFHWRAFVRLNDGHDISAVLAGELSQLSRLGLCQPACIHAHQAQAAGFR